MKIKKLCEANEIKYKGYTIVFTKHGECSVIDPHGKHLRGNMIDSEAREFIDSEVNDTNESLSELATHCVYFSMDGGKTQQIEFEGTEDECQDYVAKQEADNEFGDEAPERFVKRINESTEDTFKVGDKVFVTVAKKNGVVKKVNGEYIDVETDDGKNPVRIDTYYSNEVKKLDESETITEGVQPADEWYLKVRPEDLEGAEELKGLFIDDVIKDKGNLEKYNFSDRVKSILDKEFERYSPMVTDESLTESIDTVVEEGPKEGAEFGLASLLNTAIQEELKTVDTYNSLAITARAEGYEDIAKMIDEINTEENKHIGQLQEALKSVSPNAIAIEDGTAEGQEQMSNAIMIDDDLSDEELGMALFKLR